MSVYWQRTPFENHAFLFPFFIFCYVDLLISSCYKNCCFCDVVVHLFWKDWRGISFSEFTAFFHRQLQHVIHKKITVAFLNLFLGMGFMQFHQCCHVIRSKLFVCAESRHKILVSLFAFARDYLYHFLLKSLFLLEWQCWPHFSQCRFPQLPAFSTNRALFIVTLHSGLKRVRKV